MVSVRTEKEATKKLHEFIWVNDKKSIPRPQKTNKAFIKGVKMRSEGYYIVNK